MSMTIKIPVNKIKKDDELKLIEEKLRKDPANAYTIQGIMVEVFGVKESEIHGKSFSDWKKGLPTLYSKVRRALERLEKDKKVKSAKHGKARVYWWDKNKEK